MSWRDHKFCGKNSSTFDNNWKDTIAQKTTAFRYEALNGVGTIRVSLGYGEHSYKQAWITEWSILLEDGLKYQGLASRFLIFCEANLHHGHISGGQFWTDTNYWRLAWQGCWWEPHPQPAFHTHLPGMFYSCQCLSIYSFVRQAGSLHRFLSLLFCIRDPQNQHDVENSLLGILFPDIRIRHIL